MNGSQRSSCFNHEAKRIGISFYYCLIFVLTLIGNIFIGIIVYRTRSMRKPINFFIVNIAMSDLLFPIVCLPYIVTEMKFGYYILGGPVGQALCKLNYFLISLITSRYLCFRIDSESVSYSSGSIWSCSFSSPFSTDQFKALPVLYSHHLDHWGCC